MVDETGQIISTDMAWINVCGRWPLLVPKHRVGRGELWDWWEWPRMASMRANLRPGMVLWDVGTEQGDQSALWAKWVAGSTEPEIETRNGVGEVIWESPRGPEGGIVLIEANPMVWGNIRAIWEANEITDPLYWWVGFAGEVEQGPTGGVDASMQAMASMAKVDGWPACAFGPMISDHGTRHLAYETDRSPTVTLDALKDRNGLAVDAITIDVEGAELAVLHGAAGILKRDRPLVWVSIHPEQLDSLYGLKRADVLDFLRSWDYEIEHLAAEHELHTLAYPRESRDVILPYAGRILW